MNCRHNATLTMHTQTHSIATMRKESHVKCDSFPLRYVCVCADSFRRRHLVRRSCGMNTRWIRLDCVFSTSHTDVIVSLHFICFIQLAWPTTFRVSQQHFSGIQVSLVGVQIWKRITLARQSLIERCVSQADSVIAAAYFCGYLIYR